MNTDNNKFIIAVAFSFLILLLYPVYLKWVSPPQAAPIATETNLASNEIVSAPQAILPAAGPESAPQLGGDENLYHFSNQHFKVEFSNRGGAITKLVLTKWGKKIIDGEAVLIDRSQSGNGAFVTAIPGQGIDFGQKAFSLERLDEQKGEIDFTAEEPGKWLIRKKFRFDSEKPFFELHTEIQNLSSSAQSGFFELSTHFLVGLDSTNQTESESFVLLPDKLVSAKTAKIKKKPSLADGKILWQALTRHFFALVVYPDQPAALVKTTTNNGNVLSASIQFTPDVVQPGQTIGKSFLVYAGPKYYRDLKSFDHGFEKILSHGFFGIFKLWLLIALQWTYGIVKNYGWAIVLITFAIKLIFTPLTHMSFESMKKMQALQPKLKSLQEQHKGDQARLSKEMMELYKKHKVNPMSGCLPMVLQIPVFIAFYQVLAQTAEFQGEPFIWWIRDLSEPDRAWILPFAIPFLGNAVNVLPLLMIGSMVWQQKLTPQTAGSAEQQKMMMFMPVIFGFIFYKLPSGLVLYWFVNNLLSIFHQLFVKGKALPHHEE